MIRNESITRVAMFLCFGAAILSLAVHWRVTTTQQQSDNSAPNRKFPGSIGETAFGASTTADESIPKQDSDRKSGIVIRNVARDTAIPNNRRFVGAESESKENRNTDTQPKSFFTQFSTQQKTASKLGGMKMQVVVDLSDRRTYVYQGDLVIASYPIAIGKKGWETPTGSFQVMNMQHDPIWRHPITGKVFPAGSDSPLGERWIGFWTDGRNEIGFHGTPDIHLLGTAISHGCLRMRNSDVRLLYDQVKVGTLVTVRD
ncbi:L,D-transpeptidase [Aulosira sp. FACHB-615]|uniref:L,D-transpeptidase n=2 Tax=Nostocales TaxID=1161 RepID=UPI001685CAB3|nr:L,D-transpeptidase family protein [Aulosira sp. FACHB-615]MBD2487590.1 L,D-transpeptidase family protein [Aulosira sp. FACHB-615]